MAVLLVALTGLMGMKKVPLMVELMVALKEALLAVLMAVQTEPSQAVRKEVM